MRRLQQIIFATTLCLGTALLHAQASVSPDDLQHALKGKRFDGIHATVNGTTVTLTGETDLLANSMDAANRVKKIHGVTDVQNQVTIAAGEISDAELQAKLSKALTYDRVGYGTTIFNAIGLQVHDGVVRITGAVYGPPDKQSALDLVENTHGVRGLIDDLKLEPLSPNDDRIRREAVQKIYGYPQLNRYALDPAKTIRIIVENGHITLEGVVDSQADKDVAGLRANSVSGAFSVVNDLQVAGKRE